MFEELLSKARENPLKCNEVFSEFLVLLSKKVCSISVKASMVSSFSTELHLIEYKKVSSDT